jgi:hypothetical protein
MAQPEAGGEADDLLVAVDAQAEKLFDTDPAALELVGTP